MQESDITNRANEGVDLICLRGGEQTLMEEDESEKMKTEQNV